LQAEERRAVLLDAGRRVFAERGYRSASLDDVAAVAGVTKPVLYQHFSSKEEFYEAIAHEEMDEILKRLAPTIASGDPRKLIEAGADAWLCYIEDRPDGFAALASHAPIGWHTDEHCGDLRRGLYATLERNVSEHLRTAGLEDDLAGVVTFAIVGAWVFIGQWWAHGKDLPREDAARVMTSILWNGLAGLPDLQR
jgi:AcrR family transcriptional regulator